MEAMYVIVGLAIYVVGIATGIYAASQIEKDIDKRTGSNYDDEPEFAKRKKK